MAWAYTCLSSGERTARLKQAGIEVLSTSEQRASEAGLRVRYDVHISCLQAIRIIRRDTSGMGRDSKANWIVKRHRLFINGLSASRSRPYIHWGWIMERFVWKLRRIMVVPLLPLIPARGKGKRTLVSIQGKLEAVSEFSESRAAGGHRSCDRYGP